MASNSIEDRIKDLAYDHSQRTEYAGSSPEENWLRAENKIRNSKRSFGQFIEQASELIKPSSELTTRMLVLVSGFSLVTTVLGSLFLVAYLRSVGAVLPPIDSSLSILVLLVAFAFWAAFALVTLFSFTLS